MTVIKKYFIIFLTNVHNYIIHRFEVIIDWLTFSHADLEWNESWSCLRVVGQLDFKDDIDEYYL